MGLGPKRRQCKANNQVRIRLLTTAITTKQICIVDGLAAESRLTLPWPTHWLVQRLPMKAPVAECRVGGPSAPCLEHCEQV